MAHLSLSFCGRFQAVLDGKPLIGFHSPRVQGLFAYLVIESDGPHPRAALAALFWPDEPEEVAKQNLRQALYQLRQLLEPQMPPEAPYLLVTRDTVQFNTAADYTLDVTTCRTYLEQGQFDEAVALYRGDLLADLTSNSPLFEEWLLLTRVRLQLALLAALHELAVTALAQGNYVQAQTYTRRQLALEPWREEAHRLLILILARSGQRAAALAQYEVCRRVLADELGIEPDAETQALVAHIRTGHLEVSEQADIGPAEAPTTPQHQVAQSSRYDWGEAPDIATVYGRDDELRQLAGWIVAERCRLISVLGMGGIGKTTLAANIARRLASDPASILPATGNGRDLFESVIWRSLLNAPPLTDILHGWMQVLSGQQLAVWPESLDAQLGLLFDHLRQYRCLLVLDNVESIMQAGERAGYYRPGYEAYGQLFKRLGESAHKSCLLLTSREQPHTAARLERETQLVRSLNLSGVSTAAGQAILNKQGVARAGIDTDSLVQCYSGNPLALMLVAETIQEAFAGDITAFLHEEAPIFDDIRDVLDTQFARLAPLEQELLIWLALEREPVTADHLSENLRGLVTNRRFLEALNSLRRHSLLEKTVGGEPDGFPHASDSGGFTLPNVVIEYLTDVIIDQVCDEIETTTPHLLQSHALLKAQAKEYVRASQERLLLQPIGQRLSARLGRAGLEDKLAALLDRLRSEPEERRGYAGGNILNLLLHLDADLRRFDFTGLALHQAYLQGARLAGVSFAHSDLAGGVFTDVFSGVVSLGFSPDGRLLAGGTSEGEIRLWRVADGQACGQLQGHSNYVWSVVFDPTGSRLASCSDDGLIRLWDLSGGPDRATLVHTLRGHSRGVWRLDISPDGRLLASASADRTVRLWDLATGRLLNILGNHTRGARGVTFSADGAFIATSDAGAIRVWDTARGELRMRLVGHTRMVWGIAFSPDGRYLASGSEDHTVLLWRLPALPCTGRADRQPDEIVLDATRAQALLGHAGRVSTVAFSPDSATLASSNNDHTVRLWDVGTGQARRILSGHADAVNCAVFSPDGRLLASGGSDQKVCLWEWQSGHVLRTMQGHIQGVTAVAFSPDGSMLASACQDSVVHVWNLSTQTVTQLLIGHTKEVDSVAYSPDGELLASSSADQTIRLWETRTGKLRQVLRGHTNWVRSLVFTQDGAQLVSGSSDATVRLWDSATGALRRTLQNHNASTWCVAVSPDGATIAAGGVDHAIHLWNTVTGELSLVLHGHSNWVTCLAFSPDSTTLASGSGDHTVRLWNSRTGESLGVLAGHQDWVFGVAINAEGTLLASAGADRAVHLWEMTSGTLLHTFRDQTTTVRSVAFNPGGSLLAGGSIDGTVRLWELQSGQCRHVLQAPRPYEGLDLTGATGLTATQRNALRTLGAVEDTRTDASA